MPGADDCWTDHRLLLSRFNFAIRKPTRHCHPAKKRFDCGKLNDPEYLQRFQEAVQLNLEAADGPRSTESHWTTIRDALSKAAEKTIGFSKKKHRDWFDDNDSSIETLINKKRTARIAHENHPSESNKLRLREAQTNCTTRLREMQNVWWQEKAKTIQSYADQRNLRSCLLYTSDAADD